MAICAVCSRLIESGQSVLYLGMEKRLLHVACHERTAIAPSLQLTRAEIALLGDCADHVVCPTCGRRVEPADLGFDRPCVCDGCHHELTSCLRDHLVKCASVAAILEAQEYRARAAEIRAASSRTRYDSQSLRIDSEAARQQAEKSRRKE